MALQNAYRRMWTHVFSMLTSAMKTRVQKLAASGLQGGPMECEGLGFGKVGSPAWEGERGWLAEGRKEEGKERTSVLGGMKDEC